jgi:protein SCO1/2
MNRLRCCGVLVVIAMAISGCTGGAASTPSASPSELTGRAGGKYQGLGLTPPQPRPQFTLTDTLGKQFRFGTATQGKPTMLFFGFTHCPDICPATLADLAVGLRQVPASVRKATQVVFVTTDVKRDTAPVIATWLRHFDRDLPNKFIGLRGTQVQVDAAQAAAHVTLAEDDGQTHSSQVLLYGSDDYASVAFLQSNNQADQVAHDLPLVAGTQ